MLTLILKILHPIVLSLFIISAYSQVITTATNGAWDNPTIWSGGVVPSSANATQIRIDHDVTLPAGYSVSVFGLIINNNLTLITGSTLTILEDAAPAVPDLLVTGTLIAEDGAVLVGTTTANTFFASGSVYIHRQGPLGFVPLATWHNNATFSIAGFKGSGYINIAHSDGWKQNFGNVEYDCPEQTIFVVDLNGYLRNIAGDFVIRNTNNQTLRLSTTQNPNITIGGSLIVEGPSEVWFSTNGSNTRVDIQQDFIYNSSSAGPSYFTTRGVCTVNVSGDMEVDSPGPLRMTSSAADSIGSRQARLNLRGDLSIFSGTIIAPPLGSGKGTVVFEGLGIQSVVASPSGTSFLGNLDYIVEAASTVNLGNSALSNAAGSLRVRGRLQVGSSDPDGAIQLINKGNIHIPGQRIFEAGSTIEYKGLSPQWIGAGFPSGADVSLVCNNPSELNFTQDVVVKDFEVLQGAVRAELYSISLHGDMRLEEGITFQPGLVRLVGDADQEVSAEGVVLKELNIDKSGSSVVRLMSPLFISGVLSIVSQNTQLLSNDFLTLLSVSDDSGGTARVGPLPTGSELTGDVTCQRYMSGEGRIYRYISSPVENATVASLMDDFPVTGLFDDPSTGPGISSISPSLFYYDESKSTLQSGWQPYPVNGQAVDNPLQTGRGYAAFIRNGTSPTVWDVTGRLNQGTISLPVTFTSAGEPSNGWNLVGNPYACAIDWDVTGANGWTKQNISPVISLRDNGVGGGGTFYYWDGDNSFDDIPNGQIASGQSMWVRATGTDPLLTIREGVKVVNDVTFYRKKSETIPAFALILTRDGITDKAYFKVRRGANEGLDDWDAPKLENDLFDISVLIDDSLALAISATDQMPCHSESIAIGVKDLQVGNYSLSLVTKEALRNFTYTLIDRYLKQETVLSVETMVQMVVTEDAASAAFDRFVLRMDEVTPDVRLRVSAPGKVCEKASTQVTVNAAQEGVHYALWTKSRRRLSEEYVGDGTDLGIRLYADSLQSGENIIHVEARAVCQSVQLLDRVMITKESLPVLKLESKPGFPAGTATLSVTADKEDVIIHWYETEFSTDPVGVSAEWVVPHYNQVKKYYASGTSVSGCSGKRVSVFTGGVGRYADQGAEKLQHNTLDEEVQFWRSDIELYPNPASGRLVVRCRGDEIKGIEFINPVGIRIAQFDETEFDSAPGSTVVNVSSMPDGSYLAVVKGRRGVYYSRFVKVAK